MKKFLAVILAITTLMCSGSVFAATNQEIIDIITKSQVLSADFDGSVSVKLTNPLSKELDPEGEITKMVDGFKMDIDGKIQRNKEMTMLKTEMNIKAGVLGSTQVWMEMDFTKEDAPVYKIIMKMPGSDKYQIMDYSKVETMNISGMKTMIKNFAETESEIYDMYKLELDGDKIIATMSNESFKEFFGKIMTASMDEAFKSLSDVKTDNADAKNEEAIAKTKAMMEKMTKINLFEDEAMKMTMTLNKDKLLEKEEGVLNVKAAMSDIADLIPRAAGTEPSKLTKENSTITGKISIVMNYKNQNKEITFTLPELTKENSIDLFAMTQELKEPAYDDIADSYAADDINGLSVFGIIKGENGKFRPKDTVTRAEFAKLMGAIQGFAELKPVATDFDDVDENHWASGYIKYCFDNKIVNGATETTFAPENTVLYEEAVKMVVVNLGYEPMVKGGYPNGYIETAKEIELLSDLQGKQGEALTRESAAKLLSNAINTPLMVTENGVNKILDGQNDAELKTLFVNIILNLKD